MDRPNQFSHTDTDRPVSEECRVCIELRASRASLRPSWLSISFSSGTLIILPSTKLVGSRPCTPHGPLELLSFSRLQSLRVPELQLQPLRTKRDGTKHGRKRDCSGGRRHEPTTRQLKPQPREKGPSVKYRALLSGSCSISLVLHHFTPVSNSSSSRCKGDAEQAELARGINLGPNASFLCWQTVEPLEVAK